MWTASAELSYRIFARREGCLQESGEDDLNEDDPDEEEVDLGVEEILDVSTEQELPEEGEHLPTEREPDV
ncbi:hypothetical protein NDU88_001597 [Pleurodeles waltl]|uniref:Uncharacterized protein n=1 Tax=Pleurodeles waltl TaxID=8319 RepID=A0AAV7WN52_PLEWA|nr:hypothetical protein NDU88_001597 [Pleurodeles waltl]